METVKHVSHPRPVLTQTQNNATIWIGHLENDPTDHFAGQTFKCPSEGLLDNIQLYSSTVPHPGHIELTLHEFDEESRTWGHDLGHCTLALDRGDDARWIRFNFSPVQLKKGAVYGFRLQTPDALVGLGEAASGTKQPFNFGQEWHGDSMNRKGNYFTYFSLTFKVEMVA